MTNYYKSVINSLPSHLQQFAVSQNYQRYTPRDHAVWRYIMRKNIAFLGKHAHPSYLDGLKKTGITVDKIPNIDEMNSCLGKISWRAVVVDGFIPPAAFMEFQFHKILVISAEMRTFAHILYTPAPDIVHEAAGHAPLIADEEYADYLQAFGECGTKAISSKQDFEIYEAIRYLSIIKEYPNASQQEIKQAEKDLENKIAANTVASEAAKLSRLHWWTVEYGLYGTPENFSIYGAGLLSSVGESQACLKPKVKKIPLSVDCVNQNYDITTMQPQLYVNRNWRHLKDVLNEFSQTMSYKTGGLNSLQLALESENVATIVLSSGLQVSGRLVNIESENKQDVSYFQTKGNTAMAFDNQELPGHGIEYHQDGFGSPVGRLKNAQKLLEDFSDTELERLNIKRGLSAQLNYDSGITVSGKVKSVLRKNNKVILISFSDCRVTSHKDEVLFRPDWGIFDLAVGERVVSVYSGTADKSKFNVFPEKSEKKAMTVKHSKKMKELFQLYGHIRNFRTSETVTQKNLQKIYSGVKNQFSDDWLIKLELLELANLVDNKSGITVNLVRDLEKQKKFSDEHYNLIDSGLELLNG